MMEESYDNYGDDETVASRKRTYEKENDQKSDQGKRVKRGPGGSGGGKQPLLKLLVPNYAAGAIIGKGGANIGDLQRRYGASIRLSHNREFYPGTDERIAILTGEVSQIIDFNNYIIDKVYQDASEAPAKRPRDADRGQQVKIVVPNSTAGLVIGRGGSTIKALQEDTKAKIMIVGRDESKVFGERVLTITGNTEQRIEAARQVISKIAADPDNMSNNNLRYSRESNDNRDNYPMDNPQNGFGGMMGNFPPDNQSNPNILSALSQNPLSALGLNGLGGGLGNIGVIAQQLADLNQQKNNNIQNNIRTTVQIQMDIPEILVGHIMGVHGNSLQEFIQFSGAKIQFAKNTEYSPGTNDRIRVLTIHGDLNQTQIGYYLINQKITQARSDLAGFQRH